MPPLPHAVETRAGDQPPAVEDPDHLPGVDALLQQGEPARTRRGAERPEGPPPQVQLGFDVVVGCEQPDVGAAEAHQGLPVIPAFP